MKAEKGVFSWNLPRLGIDLLLRPPHPAGRFLSPGSRVWGCFGAFPRRRFHLCIGRFSTRFELESNRDRKAGIAGRIRPRRARPRRGPQRTHHHYAVATVEPELPPGRPCPRLPPGWQAPRRPQPAAGDLAGSQRAPCLPRTGLRAPRQLGARQTEARRGEARRLGEARRRPRAPHTVTWETERPADIDAAARSDLPARAAVSPGAAVHHGSGSRRPAAA